MFRHVLVLKAYADANGYKFMYRINKRWELYEDGKVSTYYPNICDEFDETLDLDKIENNIVDKIRVGLPPVYILAHVDKDSNVVWLSDKKTYPFFATSWQPTHWSEYCPAYSSPWDYQAKILRDKFEISSKLQKLLNKNTFYKYVSTLGKPYICAHVRWTDKIHGNKAESDYISIEQYCKGMCMLREKTGVNTIVLCTDNRCAIADMLWQNKIHNLGFDIIYDKEEVKRLPAYEPTQHFSARCTRHETTPAEHFEDFININKVLACLKHAHTIVGCSISNVFGIMQVYRNNPLDINLSGKTTTQRSVWFTAAKTAKVPKIVHDVRNNNTVNKKDPRSNRLNQKNTTPYTKSALQRTDYGSSGLLAGAENKKYR